MEVKFEIPQCPFDKGNKLYGGKILKLKPGFTPFVGCNGSGKSTLLVLLKDLLKEREGAVILKYDDRYDGGHNLMDRMAWFGDMESVAGMLMSSEGERIYRGVRDLVGRIARTVRGEKPKELWILMDAVGSGLSIDFICEIKDIFPFIQEQNPGIDCFFLMPTNEYEFARGEDCVDVTTFKHVRFKDYEDYREHVLNTRRKKDARGW